MRDCFLVDDPFLVVVRDSIIYGISLNPDDKSNDAMVPVAGLQNGYDVDFDDNEQTIYWVEHPVRCFLKILFPVPVHGSAKRTCVLKNSSAIVYTRRTAHVQFIT